MVCVCEHVRMCVVPEDLRPPASDNIDRTVQVNRLSLPLF